jgi:hypothetical protein
MARVPDNSITLRGEKQRAHAIDLISRLKIDEAKPFTISIAPFVKKRSLNQLALYFKWVNDVAEIISEYSGATPEETHVYLKTRFLPPKVIDIGGEVVEWYTTTKLSAKEMSEYMDRIYAWATSDLGLVLPIPEDRQFR